MGPNDVRLCKWTAKRYTERSFDYKMNFRLWSSSIENDVCVGPWPSGLAVCFCKRPLTILFRGRPLSAFTQQNYLLRRIFMIGFNQKKNHFEEGLQGERLICTYNADFI